MCDPTYLFDCDEYKRHGAIFWPDYACWTLKPGVWKVFGMMDMAEPEVAEHERAFESGQYLIDKRRCDRELRLSLFYAEHSDFTFQHVYGDKECFHLGWPIETETSSLERVARPSCTPALQNILEKCVRELGEPLAG